MAKRKSKTRRSLAGRDADELAVTHKAARICSTYYGEYDRARCLISLSKSTLRAVKHVKNLKIRDELKTLARQYHDDAEKFYRKERRRAY